MTGGIQTIKRNESYDEEAQVRIENIVY